MPFPRHTPTIQPQRGASLMVMLVILVIGIAAMLVGSLNSSALNNARQQQTSAALAQAKDALIGYAMTYGDTHSGQVHGYLPCPDNSGGNPEGSAEPNCGFQDISVIGRLPWATLDLPTLRDGNGECLWYAVSGTYKNNPKTGLMNWDTNGQFLAYAPDGTLLTTDPGNQVVAVIFAPGATQTGQNRSGTTAPVCGGNYTVSNYLDNDTAHNINNTNTVTAKFIQGSNGGIVNDQMVFITRQDIWNAVQKRTDFQLNSSSNVLYRMSQAAATCMAKVNSPPPSPKNSANSSVGWMTNLLTSANCGSTDYTTWQYWWSNWSDHLFYDPSGAADVNGTQYNVVVLFANPKLSGQARLTTTDKNDPKNYLEGNNLKTFNTGAPDYRSFPPSSFSATANDVLYCANNSFLAVWCP